MYAFSHLIYLFELTLYFIVSKRKRPRCGGCDGCQVSEDCGTCSNCLDKPKIGGAGREKQCCIKKICTLLIIDISTFIMGFTDAMKEYDSKHHNNEVIIHYCLTYEFVLVIN